MNSSQTFKRWKESGDPGSFIHLFDTHCRRKCCSTARRLLRKSPNLADDIEDVVQSVQAELLAKKSDIANLAHFEGRACIYAKRFALQKVGELGAFVGAVPEIEVPDANKVLEELDAREVRAALEESLAELSDQHQLVIRLHYYEQLTLAEVAEVVREKVETVKHRRDYGRRKLLELARERLGEAA